ncbi:hypothetical protein [Endozoicomonas sp. Mp262]|uniref:papain-like cysteine protease family protein n=1 Tax=Endozoicomonas sp. Mp262 TaxID=2919499 RepID=UPI0021D8D229
MKITIEHESARKLGINHRLETVNPSHDLVLDFSLEQQFFSSWCWAAIAASLAKFYGTCGLNQQQVACTLLGIDARDLPDPPDNDHSCNCQMTVDKSLALVGCYSHWSLGRPSFERIFLEIHAARLPCVRIEWFQGGAHYLVIKGVTAEGQLLHIEDSLYGPAVLPYGDFPKGYRGTGAVWTETFWTAPDKINNNETSDHE